MIRWWVPPSAPSCSCWHSSRFLNSYRSNTISRYLAANMNTAFVEDYNNSWYMFSISMLWNYEVDRHVEVRLIESIWTETWKISETPMKMFTVIEGYQCRPGANHFFSSHLWPAQNQVCKWSPRPTEKWKIAGHVQKLDKQIFGIKDSKMCKAEVLDTPIQTCFIISSCFSISLYSSSKK